MRDAATRLLRRLRALFEPGAVVQDWQAALAELRIRYPRATTSTLFCVYTLQIERSLRTPFFRDEAAAHGIKVSGRALHVARQLLGIREDRDVDCSQDGNQCARIVGER